MKQESVPTCVKISAKCQELYYEIVFLVVFLCYFALSFSIDIVYILVIDCDKFLSCHSPLNIMIKFMEKRIISS